MLKMKTFLVLLLGKVMRIKGVEGGRQVHVQADGGVLKSMDLNGKKS